MPTERDISNVVSSSCIRSLKFHWRFLVTEQNLRCLLVLPTPFLEFLSQNKNIPVLEVGCIRGPNIILHETYPWILQLLSLKIHKYWENTSDISDVTFSINIQILKTTQDTRPDCGYIIKLMLELQQIQTTCNYNLARVLHQLYDGPTDALGIINIIKINFYGRLNS